MPRHPHRYGLTRRAARLPEAAGLTADDRTFLIRALAMHAALTRTFGEAPELAAPVFEQWIRSFAEQGASGPGPLSGAPVPPLGASTPHVLPDA